MLHKTFEMDREERRKEVLLANMASRGDLEGVKALIAAGANVNHKSTVRNLSQNTISYGFPNGAEIIHP